MEVLHTWDTSKCSWCIYIHATFMQFNVYSEFSENQYTFTFGGKGDAKIEKVVNSSMPNDSIFHEESKQE